MFETQSQMSCRLSNGMIEPTSAAGTLNASSRVDALIEGG